ALWLDALERFARRGAEQVEGVAEERALEGRERGAVEGRRRAGVGQVRGEGGGADRVAELRREEIERQAPLPGARRTELPEEQVLQGVAARERARGGRTGEGDAACAGHAGDPCEAFPGRFGGQRGGRAVGTGGAVGRELVRGGCDRGCRRGLGAGDRLGLVTQGVELGP